MINLAFSLIAHPEILAIGFILGYLVPGSVPAAFSQLVSFIKSKI